MIAAGIGLAVAFAIAPATAYAQSNSSISAGFNGQAIPAGDWVWFAAVVQLTGPPLTAPLHIHFVDQTLTFTTHSGSSWTVNVSGSSVLYNAGVTEATTTWNASAYNWTTIVPMTYTGDVFLSGIAYKVPSSGLPAGTQVTWSGQFHTSEKCFDFNWKWAAAVYTDMPHPYAPTNNAKIGVKPVDSNSLSAYANSDHAGTPENYKAYLVAGALGGGGSNFTGSYSGTQGISVCGTQTQGGGT